MKIVVEQHDLLSALDRARRVTPSAKETPFYSKARLVAADDTLIIHATDMAIFMALRMPCDVVAAGEIGVAPADLAEMIRRMPVDAKVNFTVDGARAKISAAGTKRCFTLPVVPTTDMPAPLVVSEPGPITIAGDVLAAHLGRAIIAAHEGTDRAPMRGVAFDGRESMLRLAATDGLLVAVTDVEGAPSGGGDVRLLHLGAARVVAAEAAEMGNVGIVVDNRGFSFTSANADIFVPHVGVDFPPYQLAMGMLKTKTRVTVDVKAAIAAVKAMGTVSKSLKLTLGDVIHFFAKGEHEVAEDEIDVKAAGPGGHVHLSASILLDVLKSATGAEIEIGIAGPLDMVEFNTPGFRAIAMPLSVTS